MAHGESADLREFIREITLRIERAMQRLDRAIDVMDRKTDAILEEMRLQFAQQRAYLDDILAENRAQRDALFRILDRLDNGGSAPAA